MNELSLFSGAGGGCLGSKILGHRLIGYVENEPYCQEVLKQRIADGILDAAPIYGDIRRFISDGYAEAYADMVDLLSGGFPCQPFSVAGKQQGESDPRNMWPSTIECIRIIRPRFAFLENVPGILADKYMGRIFGDLAESGYSFRWTCLGADDVGANHRRKRLWILAYSQVTNDSQQDRKINSRWETVKGREAEIRVEFGGCRENVADPRGNRLERPEFFGNEQRNGNNIKPFVSNKSWWSTEPNVGRVAHGVASRVDRLKSIGNGQVPLCMARAFQILSAGIV